MLAIWNHNAAATITFQQQQHKHNTASAANQCHITVSAICQGNNLNNKNLFYQYQSCQNAVQVTTNILLYQ
jgi:spore coat protein U-like protein